MKSELIVLSKGLKPLTFDELKRAIDIVDAEVKSKSTPCELVVEVVEVAEPKPKKKKKKDPLANKKWKEIRLKVIARDGNQCKICGEHVSGHYLHVDHIKPKSIYPELIYDMDNLQVLCKSCNFKKGTKEAGVQIYGSG